MKGNHVFLALLGLTILIAVMTNPSQARHKEVIRNKLTTYVQKSMKANYKAEDNDIEQAGKAIGLMIGGVIIDRILDNLVSTDNYVLFSTTRITWDGKTKIIGIGAFGNVFLTQKLDDALNEGLLEKK